jgi:spermidine synthase
MIMSGEGWRWFTPLVERAGGKPERLVLVSFFLSGFAALVYEVSWLRLAGLYFESTAYSAATVVATFMGGLALGSYLAGRVAGRSRDLFLVYFNLEALIGLVALAIPLLFNVLRPLFGLIYGVAYGQPFLYHSLRILLSALLMMPPALLMGMTLPILIEALTREYAGLGRKSGFLYGLNSAGAGLGAAVCGFLLLPALGTLRATLVGVAVNLGIAFAGWTAIGRFPWQGRLDREPEEPPAGPPATRRFVLAAFAFSGFCALCYEIVWTRLLVASIGPASHSFAIVLSCFILGLAVGSSVYASLSPRIRDKILSCGLLMILTGVAAALAALFLPRLPGFASHLIASHQGSFHAVIIVKYVLAGLVVLPLTVFSGALFPAAASAYVPDAGRLSERIGRLYAANSIGAIAGSLAAGFFLLPALGAHRSALPIILFEIAAGLYVVGRSRSARWARLIVPVPAIVLILLILAPQADLRLLYGGGYIYFWTLRETPEGRVPAGERRLLYHEDGPGGTVTVTESADGGSRFLAIDGKTDGSNEPSDMTTQTMLAHVPLVLSRDARDVLIIGLGTGTTYATALGYPVERVTCVEISPQVIEASHFFYGSYDSTRMDDPRGRVVLGDGRSFMFFDDGEYDVIIAEPSNPWLSGMGNLFTIEYFNAMRRRLTEGGICCQWVHGYRLSPRTFKSIVKTFAVVFPHVSLWWVNLTGGDFLLVGSERQPEVAFGEIEKAESAYGIRNYYREQEGVSAGSFLRRFVAADRDLRRFAASGDLITDDSAFLEDRAAREIYTQYVDLLHRELAAISRPALELLTEEDSGDPEVISLLGSYEDNRRAFVEFIYSDSDADPWRHPIYLAKRRDWRRDEDVSAALGRSMTGYAELLYLEVRNIPPGNARLEAYKNILRGYTEAMAFVPPRATDVENIAVLYRDIGELKAALNTLKAGVEYGHESGAIYQMEGELLYALAREQMDLTGEGGSPSAPGGKDDTATARNYLREASAAYRRALELEPANAGHWLNLGAVMRALGDYDSAREAWQRALAIDPENEKARRALATLRQ